MTFGSLFAGIGGIDLGLERAGMQCVWQVEINEYCQRVLAKHWPSVRRWDDVRTFPPEPTDEWKCDLICGGFPCQPVSLAGQQQSQQDKRWLWPEFARVIRILQPRLVLLENVPGMLVHGFGDVLWDLAEGGYDAEWTCIPASAVGAPHRRERLFLLAYSSGQRCECSNEFFSRDATQNAIRQNNHLASWGKQTVRSPGGRVRLLPRFALRRVANGVPGTLDGIRALGNAVVPQVAELIGRMILRGV